VITLSLRPLDKGTAIQSAIVEPYADFAEASPQPRLWLSRSIINEIKDNLVRWTTNAHIEYILSPFYHSQIK
jgi:hypothetical protein